MVNVGKVTAAGHAWKPLSDCHHTSAGCFTRVLCLSGSYPQISCPWHPRPHCGRWGKHSLRSALEVTSPEQKKNPKSWSGWRVPQRDGFQSHVRIHPTQKQSFTSYLCRPKAAVTCSNFKALVLNWCWCVLPKLNPSSHDYLCVPAEYVTSAKWVKNHKKWSFCKTSQWRVPLQLLINWTFTAALRNGNRRH